MSFPPVDLPEQRWQYPPAYSPAEFIAEPTLALQHPAALTTPFSPDPAPFGTELGLLDEEPKAKSHHIAALVIGIVMALLLIGSIAVYFGVGATLVASFLALFPLGLVLTAVWWIDRWEPEPRLYLSLTFVWGAGVAAFGATGLNEGLTQAIQSFPQFSGYDHGFVLSVMVAPVVEEALKSLGLLMLLLIRGKLFSSAVDLVVYAATIASGFAFTEDILYFTRSGVSGGLVSAFFARGIQSPFAHLLFTAATALIMATVLFRRRLHMVWAYPCGLAAGVVLHAFWNFTANLPAAGFMRYFVAGHVPIFFIMVALTVYLRSREQRHIVSHLRDYARAGWFADHEVEMLGSLAKRRHALRWAKQYGVRTEKIMTSFQQAASRLALNRERMRHQETIKRIDSLREGEIRMLHNVTSLRREFFQQLAPPVL